MKLIVKDGTYQQTIQGKVQEEGKLKLDPSKKPAAIDLNIESGKDKGKKQQGIYELKGDTLRIRFGNPGEDKRPTALTSEDGAVMTFRRDKK